MALLQIFLLVETQSEQSIYDIIGNNLWELRKYYTNSGNLVKLYVSLPSVDATRKLFKMIMEKFYPFVIQCQLLYNGPRRIFIQCKKNSSPHEVFQKYCEISPGLEHLIFVNNTYILEYENHYYANLAASKILTLIDDKLRSKVLHVKNTHDISKEDLLKIFLPYGVINNIEKIRNFAFIEFNDVSAAFIAKLFLNNLQIGQRYLLISYAKSYYKLS